MSLQDAINNLVAALPRSFDFYHLGKVELSSSADVAESRAVFSPATPFTTWSVDRLGIAFTIHGEAHGTLALLFDEGLDVSTYSELGNIIASRMATDLQDRQGIDVIISPPKVLTRSQIQKLVGLTEVRSLLYLHRLQNRVIPLQTLLLSSEKTTHV